MSFFIKAGIASLHRTQDGAGKKASQ